MSTFFSTANDGHLLWGSFTSVLSDHGFMVALIPKILMRLDGVNFQKGRNI